MEIMELKVQELNLPQEILFNYDELKEGISTKMSLYKNMVYTDDTIKEAKADKAELNKLIRVLDDERKNIKKECLRPYETFEIRVKELIGLIDEPIKLIDTQINSYEDKKKQEKLDKIKAYWEEQEHPEWLMCNMIFDKRWLNTTFSLKKVKETIDERLSKIKEDIEALERLPEFSFEALENYKQTMDVAQAIAEGQRLADIQRRKLEAEAAKAEAEAKAKAAREEAKRQEEERQKQLELEAEQWIEQPSYEPIDEPTVMPQPKQIEPEAVSGPVEERQWVRFAANLTVADALALRDFFTARNIEFKSI